MEPRCSENLGGSLPQWPQSPATQDCPIDETLSPPNVNHTYARWFFKSPLWFYCLLAWSNFAGMNWERRTASCADTWVNFKLCSFRIHIWRTFSNESSATAGEHVASLMQVGVLTAMPESWSLLQLYVPTEWLRSLARSILPLWLWGAGLGCLVHHCQNSFVTA